MSNHTENYEKLAEVIKAHRNEKGALMPVLQQAQNVLNKLCEELGVQPGNTTADGLFTVQATRCLGACGLAPVMMINDEVYGRLTPEQIPGILAKYRAF